MSDEINNTKVGATVTNVNGKGTSTIWLRGDEIGAPGATYPDGSSPNPSKLGCVKAGTNITIDTDGTINASGTIGTDWSAVSNKPFKTVGTGLTVDGNGALNVTGGGGSVDWSQITNKPSTFAPPIATDKVLGGVKQGTNITISVDGTISATGSLGTDWSQITNKPTAFPPTPANGTTLGGVKAGANITIAADGTISATGGGGSTDWSQITNKPSTFPVAIAAANQLGGIKVGAGLNVQPDGTLSAQSTAPTWSEVTDKPATFPVAPATRSTLGGVIAGTGVNIDGSGVITVNSAAPSWNDITGKPATFIPPIASSKQLGGVKEGAGINIEADGTINTVQAAPYWNEVLDKPATFPVAIATKSSLGGVSAGPGVSITEAGEISVNTTPPSWDEVTDKPTAFNPVIASSSVVGGVKSGNNISIDPDGTINAAAIDIPVASNFTLGAIKVGNGLTIQEDGTLGTESAAPYWTEIVGKPDVYPPSIAADGVVGGIMPDDTFAVSPSGLLSAKPFTGRSFAVVQYDDTGKIIPSYTMENHNGNLILGGVQPTGEDGEEVTFGGALTLKDKSGTYKSTIYNDSFDYDIALTNGPNVKKGFLPFVTNVVGEIISLGFGSIVDAIGYATTKTLGIVQVGTNIDVDSKGLISVKTANKSELGLMIAGDHLNVDKGVVTPAIATNDSPGIVQVGEGLSVDANGVISTTNAIAFVNIQKFVGAYGDSGFEWDLPEGVDYFRVTCIGPGGHGGARDTVNTAKGIGGGGGGAGGFVQAMFRGYKYAPGTKFAIQVGGSGYNVQGDIFKHASYIAVKGDKPIIGGLGGEAGQSYNDADPVKDGLTRGGVGGKAYTGGVDVGLLTVIFAADGDHGDAGYSVTTNAGVALQIGGTGGAGIYSGSGNGVTNIGFGGGGCGAGINIDKASTAGFKEFPGVVIIEY